MGVDMHGFMVALKDIDQFKTCVTCARAKLLSRPNRESRHLKVMPDLVPAVDGASVRLLPTLFVRRSGPSTRSPGQPTHKVPHTSPLLVRTTN